MNNVFVSKPTSQNKIHRHADFTCGSLTTQILRSTLGLRNTDRSRLVKFFFVLSYCHFILSFQNVGILL